MIIGSGVDVVSLERFEALSGDENLIAQILTQREISTLRNKESSNQIAIFFALKEALFKSLGLGLTHGFRWLDVEILADGKINLMNQLQNEARRIGVSNIHSSYSCSKKYITAFVLLEG